jgi:hypothetical protein
VLEARGGADLAEKPLGAERRRELRVEDLERYEALVPEVAGEIDRCHTAAPELPLEQVAVDQGIAQLPRDVVQIVSR